LIKSGREERESARERARAQGQPEERTAERAGLFLVAEGEEGGQRAPRGVVLSGGTAAR